MSFTLLRKAYHVVIANDGAGDITFKMNRTSAAAGTVKAGEVIPIPEFNAEKVFLSNASGVNVAYRIYGTGEGR